MADRTIVLHPGFAKCATSSIQRLFAMRGHEFPRSFGVTVLGRGLRPDAGYPEVARLMYSPSDCLRELQGQDYPPGRYFLSNEAMQGAPELMAALKQRFAVESTVFTIRQPELQAISNYCFSGWLTHDWQDLLSNPIFGLPRAQDRMAGKLASVAGQLGRVQLCPVEDDDGSFYSRFCRTAFGDRPAALNKPRFAQKQSNASISLAFAAAMRRALRMRGLANIPGPARQALAKAAQRHSQAHGLPRRLPADFHRDAWAALPAQAQAYGRLLADFGVRPRRQGLTSAVAERKIAEFLDQPPCSRAEEQDLFDHAMACLQTVSLVPGNTQDAHEEETSHAG